MTGTTSTGATSAPRYGSDFHDTFSGVRVTEIGLTDQMAWDAMLLFSYGRMDEFRALVHAGHEKASESSYQLNLGLARLEGDQARFDSLGVEYAVNFNVDPPVWIETSGSSPLAATQQSVTITPVALTADTVVDTTLQMESPWALHIDFSQLKDTDAIGLALFAESLAGRADRSETTRVGNADGLLRSCLDALEEGKGERAHWLFVLACYRANGDKARFSECAERYSARLGSFTPWQDAETGEASYEPVALQGIDAGDQLSRLGFEFAKSVMKSPAYATAKAAKRPVVLDFVKMRTWSVFDISNLSACIRLIEGDQMRLHFVNVNEILISMLKSFQVDRTVQITPPGVPASPT